MFLAIFGPVFTRPVILGLGKETVGTVERKFETRGREHAFGLEVRFKTNATQSHSYWVHPVDFRKASVGETVQLKYFEFWPDFFAVKQYRQYSDSSCYIPAMIFSLLVFVTVYLLYGEQIRLFLRKISENLKVGLRFIEWSVATLWIAGTVLLVVLINGIISPY